MAIYKGFSTEKWLSTNGRTWVISDVEAVKRDLINHIFTRKGERVGLPNFGTRIPDIAFEMNDEITRKIIYDDIKEVIDFDPRVSLRALEVVSMPDQNIIIALCDINYIELNTFDTLKITIS